MTKFKEWNNYDPDIIVGGTPCQSFSIAGLRRGLADPRGNLMLTYLAIAGRYNSKWLAWENVPGVLSSNGGRDFGSFLGALAKLGYGWAYRVLDAQYLGVAQRRRRVFVVGYLGDWRRAAAVLFEQHSLSGHPAPSREKGKAVAALTANGVGTCGADDNQGQAGHLIAFANAGYFGAMREVVVVGDPLRAKGGDTGNGGETIVLMDQGGGVMNVATDGICGTLRRETHGHEPIVCMSTGQASAEIGIGIGTTLNCNHEAPICAIPINTRIATRHVAMGEGTGLGVGSDGDPAYTLQAGHSHAVACFAPAEVGPTMGSSGPPYSRTGNERVESEALVIQGMQVRRPTPVECERLQGFPDNYTNIPWRNKPEAPDSPRYKALGNSMAVPVMHWIGERIKIVEGL